MSQITELQRAVEILRSEGLVAIPTETVYGLAAKISSERALRSIFTMKNRPFFDPLIVHTDSIDGAKTLTTFWPHSAQILAEAFWPGPLTLVLPKSKKVSDLITSGLDTVAIRIPRHSMTLKMLKDLGEPVAAPSANQFGKTSPSEARHVRQEFGDNVLVVDGGPCEVGIESTIIKINETESTLHIQFLRFGAIGESELQKALQKQSKKIEFVRSQDKDSAIESPGQVKHHYMPPIPLLTIESVLWQTMRGEMGLINDRLKTQFINPGVLHLSSEPEQAARELYGHLRIMSEKSHDLLIFVKEEKHRGDFWNAILDRLQRASTYTL